MDDGTRTASPGVPQWVENKLSALERDKSDKAVVKSEVKRLESKMNDVAEDVRAGHACLKEGPFALLQTETEAAKKMSEQNAADIKGAYQWILRGLAALVLFLVTVAGGFVWYLAGMSFALKTHSDAIQEINKKLEAQAAPKLDLAPLQAMMQKTATQAATEALKNAPPPAPVVPVRPHR